MEYGRKEDERKKNAINKKLDAMKSNQMNFGKDQLKRFGDTEMNEIGNEDDEPDYS